METCSIAALGGPIVGLLGVLVALYCYFRPRGQARLAYKTCQLADFGVTKEFFSELCVCPVFVKLISNGTLDAKNITVDIPLGKFVCVTGVHS